MMEITSTSGLPKGVDTVDHKRMEAAQKLESAFLSEMLKASGLGKTSSDFGGGVGEDQFASFLRDAQAREMVKAGGLGLSQHFYNAMGGRFDD